MKTLSVAMALALSSSIALAATGAQNTPQPLPSPAPSQAPAQASAPIIEVGAILGGDLVSPWNAQGFSVDGGLAAAANLAIDLRILKMAGRASILNAGTTSVGGTRFEVEGNADLIFLQLHDIYYRTGGADGEEFRAMAGFGGGADFPHGIGRLTASAGAIAMNWQRPGQQLNVNYGAYVGGSLMLHIWKFNNELRVAYFAMPKNGDFSQLAQGGNPFDHLDTGIIGSERLGFDAFKVGIASFGPELEGELAMMPDGTEWLATLGVGGKLDL